MDTNQKKAYISPRMSVVYLQTQDIITTSGAGGFFGDADSVIALPEDDLF